MHHECFDFKSPDYKLLGDYQYNGLNIVYDILMYKARIVYGSKAEPGGFSTRAAL